MASLDKSVVDKIFVALYAILGLMIFIVSCVCIGYIPDHCQSNSLRTSLTLTMLIGICLFTIAICYFICFKEGGQCYNGPTEENGNASLFHYGLVTVFSLAIAILTALAGSEMEKNSSCQGLNKTENSNILTIKSLVWFMFAISIICIVSSSFGIYYLVSYIPPKDEEEAAAKNAGKKQEEQQRMQESFFA